MKKLHLLLILSIFLIFNSCKKEPGQGGNASITGSVFVKDYDKKTLTIAYGSHVGVDYDVYIVYGDGPGYSDKTKTDINGEYSFKYLRKGKYTVYIYTLEKGTPVAQNYNVLVAVTTEVDITNKKGSVDAGLFTIKDAY